MKKIKTLRYNSNKGLGVHSDFFKNNIVKDINSFRGGSLKLPKPQNNAEIAMLSKFIFGTELTVRFEYCYDNIMNISIKLKIELGVNLHKKKLKLLDF